MVDLGAMQSEQPQPRWLPASNWRASIIPGEPTAFEQASGTTFPLPSSNVFRSSLSSETRGERLRRLGITDRNDCSVSGVAIASRRHSLGELVACALRLAVRST